MRLYIPTHHCLAVLCDGRLSREEPLSSLLPELVSGEKECKFNTGVRHQCW